MKASGEVFSELVIGYLFLGGSGAGACFVASLLGLLSPRSLACGDFAPRYRRLIAPVFAASLMALLLGVLCLAADLGRADRILLFLASPRPTYVVVGAYALAADAALAFALALAWSGMTRTYARAAAWKVVCALEVLALIASAITMAYTGLLLQSMPAVPLWASPWLPALFVFSSLSCGTALAVGSAVLTGSMGLFGDVVGRLLAVDMLVVLLEAVFAALVVAAALQGGSLGGQTATASASSAADLVCGSFAPAFWLGFVGAGLVLPLALETALMMARRGRLRMASLTKGVAVVGLAAGVLVGGFALRWCIVSAGTHPMFAVAGL